MTTESFNFTVRQSVVDTLWREGWFRSYGAWAIADGQYGSTGKGLASALVAEYSLLRQDTLIDVVTSNQGPNAGHTGIVGPVDAPHQNRPEFSKIWKQMPIVTGVYDHHDVPIVTYLNGGAVIDFDVLREEVNELKAPNASRVRVHPHAAVVLPRHLVHNVELTRRIASTGKGTGFAAAERAMRVSDVSYEHNRAPADPIAQRLVLDPKQTRVLIEVPQGYSLGASAGFWPTCTHRECTVSQGIADAGIAPSMLRGSILCLRTFPIRVGNTEGSSGDCYYDQHEVSWEEIGEKPELTTVTKRVRRVFTFSMEQARDAVITNRPNVIFLNFVNYMTYEDAYSLYTKLDNMVSEVLGWRVPFLFGYGPRTQDVTSFLVKEMHAKG